MLYKPPPYDKNTYNIIQCNAMQYKMMQHNIIPYREIEYSAKPYLQNNPTQKNSMLSENEIDSTTQHNAIQDNTIPGQCNAM